MKNVVFLADIIVQLGMCEDKKNSYVATTNSKRLISEEHLQADLSRSENTFTNMSSIKMGENLARALWFK